jgi:hypothetical protein
MWLAIIGVLRDELAGPVEVGFCVDSQGLAAQDLSLKKGGPVANIAEMPMLATGSKENAANAGDVAFVGRSLLKQ